MKKPKPKVKPIGSPPMPALWKEVMDKENAVIDAYENLVAASDALANAMSCQDYAILEIILPFTPYDRRSITRLQEWIRLKQPDIREWIAHRWRTERRIARRNELIASLNLSRSEINVLNELP